MDYSKILYQAYESFLLPLGDQRVPTPYRINIPYQIDRKIGSNIIYLGGKSPAEKLVSDTLLVAKEENFDLEKATISEIQKFMEDNLLGIDCSGFAYHLLDNLLKKIGKGGMREIGFPGPGMVNVELLTSEDFSKKVSFKDIKPGDLIRLDSEKDIPHVLVVLDIKNSVITYTHSSKSFPISGVHQGKIVKGKFDQELSDCSYNEKTNDGVWRLKILE